MREGGSKVWRQTGRGGVAGGERERDERAGEGARRESQRHERARADFSGSEPFMRRLIESSGKRERDREGVSGRRRDRGKCGASPGRTERSRHSSFLATFPLLRIPPGGESGASLTVVYRSQSIKRLDGINQKTGRKARSGVGALRAVRVVRAASRTLRGEA